MPDWPRLDGIGMRPLSDGDLQDIHLASLEVLERTGMWVEADDAIDIFADGGCRVDRETRRVRIPPELVEDAIRSTPPHHSLVRARPQERHRARAAAAWPS